MGAQQEQERTKYPTYVQRCTGPVWDFYTTTTSTTTTCNPTPPSGVQFNLSISSLQNDGWQTWYDESYSHWTKSANIQPTSGQWVLWGSKQNTSSTTLSLAAVGRRTVVHGKADVHENGVHWYT